MDTSFNVEVHQTYLRVKHPPGFVITAAAAAEGWARIRDLCREHAVAKVLIEAKSPQRRMDTMSAFDSGRVLAENLSGLTVAMCFYDYEFDELSSFFRTVAQNRGVKIEYFNDLQQALDWLGVDPGEKAVGN
jgi:hypothetical protein